MSRLERIEALLVRLMRSDLKYPIPEPPACECPEPLALLMNSPVRCGRCWGVV